MLALFDLRHWSQPFFGPVARPKERRYQHRMLSRAKSGLGCELCTPAETKATFATKLWGREQELPAQARMTALLHNELRSMRLAISRRIDRALNFSVLWIGGYGAESALCGNNHWHSARAVSLSVAAEVVIRNWEAVIIRSRRSLGM